jgi:hypothetical protein
MTAEQLALFCETCSGTGRLAVGVVIARDHRHGRDRGQPGGRHRWWTPTASNGPARSASRPRRPTGRRGWRRWT